MKAYFGEHRFYNKAQDENYLGQIVDYHTYIFNSQASSEKSIEIALIENRIRFLAILVRDSKYAINGKLMIGDPISKISELGYTIERNDYFTSHNYLQVYPPMYKRGAEEIYYYFDIYFDSSNNIRKILMYEDIGV